MPARCVKTGAGAARESCSPGAVSFRVPCEMHRAQKVRGLSLLGDLDALNQSDHNRCHKDKGGENGECIEIADKCHGSASRILSMC
jgi:hypothetical protein